MEVKLRQEMSAQKWLCFTSDIWSTKRKSFIGVTVHWVGTKIRFWKEMFHFLLGRQRGFRTVYDMSLIVLSQKFLNFIS